MTLPSPGYDLLVGRLRDRGLVVSERDGKVTAHCPAHDDRNASLSVIVGDEGGPIPTCFAGCSREDVLAALGLTWKDVLPENDPPDHHRIAIEEAITAIDLAHLLIDHARAVFGGEHADSTNRLALRIWRWILDKDHDQFRERDCFSACRNRQVSTKADFVPALDVLCEHGYIAKTHPSTDVRPSVLYLVNPEAIPVECDSAKGNHGHPPCQLVRGAFARIAQRSAEVRT